jgi:hypothetical protein
MEEMLEFCGFNSAFDMIKTHFTEDELMDLLSDFLHENKDIANEICEEIAVDLYEWVDRDKLRADFEDAQYQAFKDRGLDE